MTSASEILLDERAKAEARIADDIVRVKQALTEAKKNETKRYKELAAADKRLDRILKKQSVDGDEMSEAETKAWAEHGQANRDALNAHDRVRVATRKLEQLQAPDAVERLLAVRPTTGGGKRVSTEKVEVPKAVIDRITKAFENGVGGPTVARQLNDDNVASPTGNPWNTGLVQRTFKTAHGIDDLKAWREKHKPEKKASTGTSAATGKRAGGKRDTVKRGTTKRAAAKRDSAKRGSSKRATAKRTGNGNGKSNGNGNGKPNGNGKQVEPISKEAQASGQSRKPAAARTTKAASVKRSTPLRPRKGGGKGRGGR